LGRMKKKFYLKKAPLVEMLLGVQFGNQTLSLPTIFSFYNEIKNDFPVIQEHPVTLNVIEHLDKPTEVTQLSGFHSRKFFITADDSKLIQLQPNRMNFNWRKNSDNDAYPRFNPVYSEFSELYAKLLKTSNEKVTVNQYEIAYINHIPVEDFQNNPSKFLSTLQFSSSLGNINLSYTIPIIELGANLTVLIQKGKRMDNNQEILIFNISLRGFSDKVDIKLWFDQAHDVLIDHFNTSITKDAKTKWEIEI
jgi:uncharacterized protein (TIGR04255 family)